MLLRRFFLALLCLALARNGAAQVFGSVRVTVHDAQDLPIAAATISIRSNGSTWTQTTKTDDRGDALFAAVPFGAYRLSITSPGFDPTQREIQVLSNTQTPVQVTLSVGGVSQEVQVTAGAQTINPESS